MYGYENIQKLLKVEIEKKAFSHAYLFSGPASIGKRITALWFTQVLFCLSEEKPCGQCFSCKQIVSLTHPDLLLIQPHMGKKIISIDQIRELHRKIFLKPFSSEYKVVVIDQVEFLNKESANALLKLLEEPPKDSILFLITSSPSRLLPTVLSRVRTIRFGTLPKEKVITFLKSKHLSEEKITQLISLAEGKIGWLTQALEKEKVIEEMLDYSQQFSQLLMQPLSERLMLAESWYSDKVPFNKFLYYLLLWWHDVIFLYLGKIPLLHFSFDQKISQLIAKFSFEKLINFLSFLADINEDQMLNLNKRLIFENIVIQMPESA